MRASAIFCRIIGLVIVLSPAAGLADDWLLGPEELVTAGGATIMVPGYSVPSFAHWDDDGRLDLIVGEGSGTSGEGLVRVYLNIGTVEAPAFGDHFYAQSGGRDLVIPSMGCLGCFPRVVHWDDDGRKDLLVGSTYGNVFLFLNIGTDAAPEFGPGTAVMVGEPGSAVPIDIGSRATPSLVDWNADGRRDLVSGDFSGHIHVFLNEGTDAAPVFLSEFLVTGGGDVLEVPTARASPVVCDLDGDGCKDILCGNTAGQLLLYVNVGTDAAPAFEAVGQALAVDGVPIDLEGDPRSRPFVCDWTGDGRLDVLVGAGDGHVHLFQGTAGSVAAPDLMAATAQLLPPWPNPANPRVTVAFVLNEAASARLTVWDVRGRRVATLAAGRFAAGAHEFAWNGNDAAGRPAASGTYLARLEAGATVVARKIVLAR